MKSYSMNDSPGPSGVCLPAIALAMASLWLFAGEAQAQMGLGAEGRVGVTFPQGDLSDAGAEAGLSFGAELQVNFHPRMTAYLGLQRHSFNCENGCTLGDNPRSTGIGAGLKYIFHNPGDVLAWGRGGIVANTFGNDSGPGTVRSDSSWAWERTCLWRSGSTWFRTSGS
jgi:hypothetical protein